MDKEKYIVEAKMTEELKKPPFKFKLGDKCVKNKHIDDSAVDTRTIKDKAVTPEKISDDFKMKVVLPSVDIVDHKYADITNELYSMVASLQVGGIALSQKLGDREDIGISQKALTEILLKIWNKIGEMTGESYTGFTMTVVPDYIATEHSATVDVTADSTGGISNFDQIRIYANEVLKAEDRGVDTLNVSFDIDETTIIKCIATIAGRTYTKEKTVTKYVPFFMGSGGNYQEVLNTDCLKDLDGTLEGDYNITIRNSGDHIFIVFPKSHEAEFRRADMNGYEIPVIKSVIDDIVVLKSQNIYQAGTYNIDININT